jgi:acyl phosphate:glycerol-3-phosphate acyltransferase
VLPLSLALVALAYLLGSIPVGLTVGRVSRGVDIRKEGSGNIGFTNAVRVLGPRLGVLVFALDFSKGLLAAGLARLLLPVVVPGLASPDSGGAAAWAIVACGVAVVAGHNWSAFEHFTGGKGVATGVGAVFAFSPMVGAALLLIWGGTVAATRYVSVGSMVATVSLTPIVLLVWPGNVPYLAFALVGAAVVVFQHRSNLRRLAAGEERRLGGRKADRDA